MTPTPGECALCGCDPARGYAQVDGRWLCHPDDDSHQDCFQMYQEAEATMGPEAMHRTLDGIPAWPDLDGYIAYFTALAPKVLDHTTGSTSHRDQGAASLAAEFAEVGVNIRDPKVNRAVWAFISWLHRHELFMPVSDNIELPEKMMEVFVSINTVTSALATVETEAERQLPPDPFKKGDNHG